jgi:peptide deformylase
MNIVKFPDPILQERMPEFDFDNPVIDPVQLEKDLIETMFKHDGIGLAANQVGIRARVFVMGHRDSPETAQAFFNPKIVANTNEMHDLEEGCLSFPGIFTNVKRPSAIIAEYQTADGTVKKSEFVGYDCKVFLHEHDHLEGITFHDRVSALKWALAVKKSKKGNKNVRTK